ncbi:hypothetical protein [Cryobacterium tagatosivorans]|uniref:Uncharacterized protein n=1 Tax=Cryobacterium tagatosivorans TaxID=1259199 RepID=A0A4R8UEM5_9MICO|nr:hypothetical protein [Cryobacterium tagatosivorans]TFB50381.1 hypothetical protein E3O23_09550 [Cryobacterium tagatosivorans]
MTSTASTRKTGSASRRVGYAFAIAINGVLLYLVNVWPGWQIIPFLTADFREVLGLVNASLIAGMVVNFFNLLLDWRWVRAVGDLVTLGIGLAGLVLFWQVFPFDFPGAFDWSLLVRIVIVLAMVGTVIGMIVQVVTLIRSLAGSREADQ